MTKRARVAAPIALAARKGTGFSFDVLLTTERLQAAFMCLGRGESSGAGSVHADADQLVYVLAGRGVAVVEGRDHRLGSGSLFLIPAGSEHEIRNTGRGAMTTLNVYAPPKY